MYCLPTDTLRLIYGNLGQVDNFSLRFNKLVRIENGEPVFFRKARNEAPIDEFGGFSFANVLQNQKDIAEETLEGAKVICRNQYKVLLGKTKWRMVLGLGVESAYETSMTLHPVFGFPYIPGQALKGLIRSFIITEKFGGKEYNAIAESELFCYLFGCPKELVHEKITYKSKLNKEHAGAIVFFDAFPISEVKIEYDIMNPHYSEYYQDTSGKKPPADYYNPVPIPLVTVTGTTFQFLFGQKRETDKTFSDEKLGNGSLLDLAEKYFIEACEYFGFGAKSSAGYGYIEVPITPKGDTASGAQPTNEARPTNEAQLAQNYASVKIAKEAVLPAVITSFQNKAAKARVLHSGISDEISFTVKGTVSVGQFVKVRIADVRNGKPVTFTLNGIIR